MLNLPCRVAAPQNLRGLVDRLSGPAYATSVGLLVWAQRESLAAPRVKKRKGGPRTITMDLNKGLDLLKRFLP